MRFGARVLVRRGSLSRVDGPGHGRWVTGILIGAHGHERLVRLTQDDPMDTVGWNKAGDVGWWSKSAVVNAD